MAARPTGHADAEDDRVSTSELIRLTGARPNTLKQQFPQLVEKRHLIRHGGGRTTWYTLA